MKISAGQAEVILGLLGLLLTALLYDFCRRAKRKRLTYDYTSGRVANFVDTFGGELKITFAGRPVDDVSVVSLTLKNAGGAPIQRADYEGDLQFRFPESEALVGIQATRSVPSDLVQRVKLIARNENKSLIFFGVEPLLLNPGDQLTMLVLVNKFKNRVTAHGRVVGVSKIERRSVDSAISASQVRNLTGIFIGAILGATLTEIVVDMFRGTIGL